MSGRARDRLWAWGGFVAVLAVALGLAIHNQSQLWGAGYFDSYTLQALAWRAGRMDLPVDVAHLELALYNGQVFVSFPPLPTVPLWLLTFFFGEQPPSGLVALVYFLLCYPAAYVLMRRFLSAPASAAFSVFMLLAGSVLDLGVSSEYFAGGVWYQAQLLSLLLTLVAFWGILGEKPRQQGLGFIALALAVGCRPFQAIYLPFFIWRLYQRQKGSIGARIWAMVPYGIAPACIALAYMVYNVARFGNPFEFGHNYLPEFSTEGGVQFALAHIPGNFLNLLRPPLIDELGELVFPITLGFAVYWTNPMLTTALASLHRRMPEREDWVLLGLTGLHFLILLSHQTLGGWQYGSRYICDLIPALMLLRGRSRRSPGIAEGGWMGAMLAFNLWGTLFFHVLSKLAV